MGGLTFEGRDMHCEEADERDRVKFNVPFNWGDEFLGFVLENRQHIESVYGSLPREPTGRPIPHPLDRRDVIPDETKLKTVVDTLRSAGIDFDLIMNASCTGNILFTDAGKARLENRVKGLRDLGIEQVTVANFDLARRISAIDPNIAILMSVIFNITEPDQLLYMRKQDFNFRGLIVGKGLNRNLPKLQRFLQLAADLKTVVIANDFCPVPNCPERITDHNNTCAHRHLPFDPRLGEQQYVSPSLHCRSLVTKDPSLHLKAPVINPNDLKLYARIGARRFKLTDRIMPDRVLMAVCEAYFRRKYGGNLFDLFSYTSHYSQDAGNQRLLTPDEVESILEEGCGAKLAGKAHYLAKPYADAMDLSESGFMEMFERGGCDNNCFDKSHNPDGCHYCANFAKRYLRIDDEAITIGMANVRALIEASRKRKQVFSCDPKLLELQGDVKNWGEADPSREAHIRDTYEILRRSQEEHPERYLVQISGFEFWVYPGVFPPNYFNDTEFFAENLPIMRGGRLLEIGPGTGIVSIRALQRGVAEVVGIDISSLAVANSRENARLHQVDGKARFLEGNVYSPLDNEEKFDRIFWNVPFGCVTVPLTILERSVFDTNYAAIEIFIKEARGHLADDGKLLIGMSSVMGDFDKMKTFLSEAGATDIRLVIQKLQTEGRKKPLTFEIFEITF